MTQPVLGKLRRVDARTVWAREAHGFTPWLKENIAELAEVLQIELELVEREVRVGAYSADLFGKEVGSGREVLIENQLEPTDHSHLGQIMTYAAGLDAKIVIWISPEFRDEHRQALEWLNRQTADSLAFFGIEVEVLQIGDSLLAPNFRIVAEPSTFQREASGTARLVTPRRLAYHAFFEEMLARLKGKHPNFTATTRIPFDSWISFSAGRSGFLLNAAFARGNRFQVEFYIDTGDVAQNKAIFDQLLLERAAIESMVAGAAQWEWERLDSRRACRISVFRPGSVESPAEDLDRFKDWAVDMLPAFRSVFMPRLTSLQLKAATDPTPEEIDA